MSDLLRHNSSVRYFASRCSELAAVLVLAAASGASCSSNSSNPTSSTGAGGTSPTGDASDDSYVNCSTDPRIDTYTANMTKPGMRGALTFKLIESEPAPPARGNNVFTMKITDSGGNAIHGEVKADLDMPDHGHPATVKPVVTFDSSMETYNLDPLYFFMVGVWHIKIDAWSGAADAGAPVDSVAFYFCIQ
jgi:YtkA-like